MKVIYPTDSTRLHLHEGRVPTGASGTFAVDARSDECATYGHQQKNVCQGKGCEASAMKSGAIAPSPSRLRSTLDGPQTSVLRSKSLAFFQHSYQWIAEES